MCEIALHLPTHFDPSYIKPGNVLCDRTYPINQVTEFRAQILIFDILTPITSGLPIYIYSFSNKLAGSKEEPKMLVEKLAGHS